ncbi:hypothetical protein [Sedimenticola sp.]|uniref:hypothetical protein n=1 Tax=Sedimenticola sp. TaxID=1940285 RepID=UPI003D0F959C
MNYAAIFESWHILVIVAMVSLPVYWLLGRFFFDDWQDFLDHLRLWYQPFWLSALRGEFNEDMWAQVKLFVFLGICFGWALVVANLFV